MVDFVVVVDIAVTVMLGIVAVDIVVVVEAAGRVFVGNVVAGDVNRIDVGILSDVVVEAAVTVVVFADVSFSENYIRYKSSTTNSDRKDSQPHIQRRFNESRILSS